MKIAKKTTDCFPIESFDELGSTNAYYIFLNFWQKVFAKDTSKFLIFLKKSQNFH